MSLQMKCAFSALYTPAWPLEAVQIVIGYVEHSMVTGLTLSGVHVGLQHNGHLSSRTSFSERAQACAAAG